MTKTSWRSYFSGAPCRQLIERIVGSASVEDVRAGSFRSDVISVDSSTATNVGGRRFGYWCYFSLKETVTVKRRSHCAQYCAVRCAAH